MTTMTFTRAERSWVARHQQPQYLFDRGRDLTEDELVALAAVAMAEAEREKLNDLVAELAVRHGREDDVEQAGRLARRGVRHAHTDAQRQTARARGRDMVFNGGRYQESVVLADAVSDWAGAIAVSDIDPAPAHALAVPGFLTGTIYKDAFDRAGQDV
jgi:hypothetical protein